MTQTSYAILTATGSNLLAQAVANNTMLNVTQIVIGQGTTVPTGNEMALYDQIAVKDIADYGISESDASTFWFTTYLKAEEGPYAISEIGLLDKSGNLIAIGHLDPAIEKQVPASGQVIDMIIGLYLRVNKASAVTVTIDESISVTVSDMDTLPWLPVKSTTLTAPPAAVENGDVYYVPAGATDSWEGMVGLLAQKTTGGWRIIRPVEGHGIGLPDGSVYQYVGGKYVAKLAPLTSPTFAGLVTVPPVTDFSQELALGAKSADTRYIGRASGNQDYSPLQGGINISTGQMWFSYLDGKGAVKYAFSQVAGDYVLGIWNATTDQRILSIARNKTDSGVYVQFDDNTNQRLQLFGDYATNPALNALALTVVTKNATQGPGINNLGIVSKSGQPYCVDTAGVLRYLVKSPGSTATDIPIQSVGINNQRIYVSYNNDTQAAWLVRSPAEGSTDTRVGSVGIAGGVPYFGYGGDNDATNPLFLATQEFVRGKFLLSPSGYEIAPSGKIVQWDTVSVPASADPANNPITVNLPTSFPNECFGIVGLDFGGDCNPIGGNPLNNGQVQLRSFKRNTNASASNVTIVHYWAWGH